MRFRLAKPKPCSNLLRKSTGGLPFDSMDSFSSEIMSATDGTLVVGREEDAVQGEEHSEGETSHQCPAADVADASRWPLRTKQATHPLPVRQYRERHGP